MMRNPLTALTNRCNVFIGWVRFAVIDFSRISSCTIFGAVHSFILHAVP